MALLMLASVRGIAQNTYTMITSASGLEEGAQYILVGFDDDGNAYAMSYQKSNNRHAVTVTNQGGQITAVVATDPNSQTEPFEFTLGGNAGAWTLFDPLKNGYLYAPGGGNYLRTQTNLNENGKWSITFESDGGSIPVSNGGVEQSYMRFNINSSSGGTPLFGCYKESSSISALVYFFKAGAATPDPEPTNYPTGFNATVNGVDVTVNWTDATGAQLPHKYLVLASKTVLTTLPQDGVTYPNDPLTQNVAYGVQTATFRNLDGNSNYYFYIFPYTNSGQNIDYKTDGNYPSATAHTADITYLLNEDFELDSLGVFTAFDMYGGQSWHAASHSNNYYAYMNGYANGSAHENEDWLISPAMSGSFQSITLQFLSAMSFSGPALELKISGDYDGVSEPTEFDWIDLTDLFDWSGGDFAWVESGVVNITNFVGEPFYIAFVYRSSDSGAAAWEIDEVKVIANGPLAVAEKPEAKFVVSPNPASDNVRFELQAEAQVSVYDLSGRMVVESRMGAGASEMNVSGLDNGVYFLSVIYADGTKEVARFVKF